MSKNKPMTRIDLDYNKNLKYPDINDYLRDTVYASNLTEFPDNQLNAVTSWKLVANTAEWGRKVSIASYQWQVYLGTFKLYGYNPDLEAVERMDLVIDFVNDGNDSNNYTKQIRKRGTAITFNVVSAADPESLPLVGVVNYYINFTASDMEDIYDYVFGTQWLQASEHYQQKVYTVDPTEEEKQSYINYVKYRIYKLKIPVKINYYYVNATDPGGTINFNMTLNALLPMYQNKVDFASKVIELNNAPDYTVLDYFKLSYTSSNLGKMRLKATCSAAPDATEVDPLFKEVGTSRESRTTSLGVRQLMSRQHSGYDISYPTLRFTYDFGIGAESVPILQDEEFDVYEPAPTARVVDPITVVSYRYGNDIKKINPQVDNPFKFSITFTTKNKQLVADIKQYKFRIEFRNPMSTNAARLDNAAVAANKPEDYLLIGGNLQVTTRKAKRTKIDDTLLGTVHVYRSNTTIDDTNEHFLFSQRTGTKANDNFGIAFLSQFTPVLIKKSETATNATYTLTLTWSSLMNQAGLFNILKCSSMLFSITNAFQEAIASVRIDKEPYEIISNDLENPLLYPGYNGKPRFIIYGTSGADPSWISNLELARLDKINGGSAVEMSTRTRVMRYSSASYATSAKVIRFAAVGYVAAGTTATNISNLEILNTAYLVLAHKLKDYRTGAFAPEYTFLNTAASQPIFSNYFKTFTYTAATQSVDFTISKADVKATIERIMGAKPGALVKGSYILYMIPNTALIAEYPNTDALYAYQKRQVTPTKFRSDFIFAWGYDVI